MKPLLQAEQATLGALLLDPDLLPSLAEWLQTEHFYRPAHAALYAAMLDLHATGHPGTTPDADQQARLTWVKDTVAEASKLIPGLSPSYAHTVIAACPRPRHAPVYGRMVLEGAIHRSIAEHATRLHHTARTDAENISVEETLHYADVLADVLDDLARRWGIEPLATSASTAQPTSSAPALHPANEQQLADEEFLLSCLADYPRELGELVGWLRPEDFTDPGHQQIYRCLSALHHRGEPIDAVTMLWEAQHRGALTDGTLDADRLLHICAAGGAPAAAHLGERLLQTAVVRTAATTASHVRALAENEALVPGRLINQARHALAPLEEARRRWQLANAAPDPQQPCREPTPATCPVSARADAALARSQPHPATRIARATTTASAAPTPLHPSRRSHS